MREAIFKIANIKKRANLSLGANTYLGGCRHTVAARGDKTGEGWLTTALNNLIRL